jgi:serine/threonine-protein kinase
MPEPDGREEVTGTDLPPGDPPPLSELPTRTATGDRLEWLAALRADQQQRWRRGQRLPAEEYARRLPELAADPEAYLDLIYSEFLLRRALGESPRPEEYFDRFPAHAEQLSRQLALDRAIGATSAETVAPESGREPAADELRTDEMATRGPSDAPARPGPDTSGELTPDVTGPEIPGYEVLGELGRGGMGVVYKARQKGLGRTVALKMIRDSALSGQAERARFRAEARAIARLQHPNIVQIFEVGEHRGLPFFSLEYCPGGSLAQKLNGTPLPPKEAARLVQTLAHAVHAAHQAQVIHRDLKPANVLLTQDGQPKIADFGLAKHLDADSVQTGTGHVLGTPSYMAPEQAEGRVRETGPAIDVYALGAILYELLTGRPPFKGASYLDTMCRVVSEEPVPPSRTNAAVPRGLESICLKCLQKDPARRYPSALALAEGLGRFLDGRQVAATSAQARPPSRRRRWAWLALVFACLAVAGSLWVVREAVVPTSDTGQPPRASPAAEESVGVQEAPDLIVCRHQPPPGARVAFRMDESFHYGAVCIVFQMSGRMDLFYPGTGKKKIQMATEALGKVLETVPAGTYLSLLVFGHSETPVSKDPPWTEAVRRTKIQWLRQSKQWDRSQLKGLMASINALYPGYNAPIAEARVVAKEGGFPGGRYDGPRLILALTDGTDNLLAYDRFVSLSGKPSVRRGTQSVSVFLRKEFGDGGIEVNVVCFAPGKQEGEARKQLSVLEQLDPPGKFMAVPEPPNLVQALRLARALETSVRPRIMLRGNMGEAGGVFKAEVPATRAWENLHWSDKVKGLPAGLYTARIRGTSPQEVSLRDGESLVVTLKRAGGKIGYERELFTEAVRREQASFHAVPNGSAVVASWNLNVLQNRKEDADRTITQLVTLEDTAFRAGAGDLLEHRLPGFVWLEIRAKDGTIPEGLRWHRDAAYPSPAYAIKSAWPAAPDGSTEVRVWWSRGERLAPELYASLAHASGQPVAQLGSGRQVALEDAKAVLERVSQERRKVMASSGKWVQRLCLVVRARHDKGHPIWVRIPELERRGQKWGEEHHYFTKANRYTAVFWGLSNFEGTPFSLQVISLEAFKRRYPAARLVVPAPTTNGTGLDTTSLRWSR